MNNKKNGSLILEIIIYSIFFLLVAKLGLGLYTQFNSGKEKINNAEIILEIQKAYLEEKCEYKLTNSIKITGTSEKIIITDYAGNGIFSEIKANEIKNNFSNSKIEKDKNDKFKIIVEK